MVSQSMPSPHSNHGSLKQASDAFATLFESEKQRLYSYIYAFVLDKAAADDIFQETSVILWKEFETFEQGTSFRKWSNTIVFNCVRTYRRQQKKLVLGLSDELFEQLISSSSHQENSDEKWRILQHCVSHLSDSAYQLYFGFYIENLSAQALADKTGRSIFGIRKSIHLLRRTLFDCVDKEKAEYDN
ncbi:MULTISPECIES: sigma-70 family RNA polymerase sigma factor [unclassified Alteromonas]|uniref:sigma-70 family RNA polymerase sigma factor n=1 Tax=unclassified Alteromonas TaxID=2614992 RepID=UPI001F25F6A8|nr:MULTISPECIES: sigma-70 family RNA polymerase sigma factor [unclassified Alteromonas]